jgi:hypothetical protein
MVGVVSVADVSVREATGLVKDTTCAALILSAVTPAVCKAKTPLASPDVTSPPPPALFAEIVAAITIPPICCLKEL